MIIAEIGINHGGRMDVAKLMIERSKEAGADVAKFQYYDAVRLLGKDSPYIVEAKACQFTWKQHLELKKHCEKVGIEWLVSLFHPEHVKLALESGMKRIKVASRAACDENYLNEVKKQHLPILLSWGMADRPSLDTIGKILTPGDVTYLYCECKYPSKPTDFDFGKMLSTRKLSCQYGFSSHCPDIGPALTALDLGASVIEQHVVLDRNQKGCDVSSSITFEDLGKIVKYASMNLVPVSTPEQVEWMRNLRNIPEVYRYFRQDAPLSVNQQIRWWNEKKHSVRLFQIVVDEKPVGVTGFNPFNPGAGRAEFTLFLFPEFQKKNYGPLAMKKLLRKGFDEYNLSTIYSDVLDYPEENRFEFYRKLGFEAHPKEVQNIRYPKQGKMIPSIKFFMTKDMWRGIGSNGDGGLEPVGSQAAVQG